MQKYSSKKSQIEKDKNYRLRVLVKSLVMALIISLICIILYAIVLSMTPITDDSMALVTRIISIVSILVSSIYSGNRINKNGWLYGLILGLVYILILIPISLLWGNTLTVDKYFFAKLLMASSIGLIGGAIGVNIT